MRKNYKIKISMSKYDPTFKRGRAHYSVGCVKNFGNTGGFHCPCDTEKQVIREIVEFLKDQQEDEHHKNHRPPAIKNTEFENSVAELKHITLGYLLNKIRGYEQRNLAFLMRKTES